MPNVKQYTDTLIEQVRDSEEYRRYHQLRDELAKDQELFKQVNEYRKQCFFLQNRPECQDDAWQLEALYRDNEGLLKKGVVKAFLAAELNFCQLVTRIHQTISQALDFDISFMDEPGE